MGTQIPGLQGLLNRGNGVGPQNSPFIDFQDPFRGFARQKGEKENSLAPLMDSINLRGGSLEYMEVSLQMHMERTVLDSVGNLIGRETIDLSVHYQRLELQFGPLDPGEGAEGAEGSEGEEEAEGPEGPVEAALARLMEHFSPENTARRIADFVIRGFPRTSFGETNTGGSKQDFVEFILPYVRQGAADALSVFGNLPDEIRENAERTVDLTRNYLYDFAGMQLSQEVAGNPKPDTA